MGGVKARMMEEDARGWSSIDEAFVCADCVSDRVIAEAIKDRASSTRCDYCEVERHEPFAAPVDVVLGLVCRGIYHEWAPADEELPYETREGGFQGETVETYDLLMDLEVTDNEALFDDLVSAIHNHLWCRRDYFRLSEHKQLAASWVAFQRIVKHETRYLFAIANEITEEQTYLREHAPASETLAIIGGATTSAGLVEQVKAGTYYFRARISDSDEYHTAAELGPPPVEAARFSSRMAPAGIPMFYGAVDTGTAVEEVRDPRKSGPCKVSVGRFQTQRDLLILDLSKQLILPSLFDDRRRGSRPSIMFLRGFVRDVARPIAKDGREHIEYVPTQIVTEYFRRCYKTTDGHRLDGIQYPSCRASGGVCCVLFADASNCSDVREKDGSKVWLWLTQGVEVRDLG